MSLSKNQIAITIGKVYEILFNRYGQQYWWPAETNFEVMVGAILTQNTAWINVEKAINNLKQAKVLDPKRITKLGHENLAELLKPSGYFNVKATRLQDFCKWYINQGELGTLQKIPTPLLRQALLSVRGIGPETADDILLYAFNRPIFVIDAYTRRLLQRLDLISGSENYDQLQTLMHNALSPDVEVYQEYHALIVRHAKEHCKTRPSCGSCELTFDCGYQQTN